MCKDKSGALLSLILLRLLHEKQIFPKILSQYLGQLCNIDKGHILHLSFLATLKFCVSFNLVKYRLKMTSSHNLRLTYFCP